MAMPMQGLNDFNGDFQRRVLEIIKERRMPVSPKAQRITKIAEEAAQRAYNLGYEKAVLTLVEAAKSEHQGAGGLCLTLSIDHEDHDTTYISSAISGQTIIDFKHACSEGSFDLKTD